MNGVSISLSSSVAKKKVIKKNKKKVTKGKKIGNNIFQDDEVEIERKNDKISLSVLEKHVESEQTDKTEKDELVIKPKDLSNKRIFPINKITKESSHPYGLIEPTCGNKIEKQNSLPQIITYDELLQKELEQLPKETKQEEYDEVPVEEFGAALLRGMGWNGKDDNDTTVNKQFGGVSLSEQLAPKPAFLGIGAKPALSSTAGDGKGTFNHKPKVDSDDSFLPIKKVEKTE
ncbi:hypothetical protein TBLA_0D01880 [Henningerozyma blattae CBS 6284]|uniref:Pre-mRNA-splicing factor n=1 Tax=Henningerozyma blattae (strain ATCC 34711 / CBS 6284 / DSM 70876 / NBRC 10599 / NRRL Y-10934 / UCD 77-7) TaxID=1071380 RepID=I2H2U3_HENB6|nr:hypothetical protein TBLA_0D01880 [Tetrapisispora blattae CBS 6284]CCH60695.1 hypothetical protein TBLA_0D01880 [Tetrapisispora blattae CBS 6284]